MKTLILSTALLLVAAVTDTANALPTLGTSVTGSGTIGGATAITQTGIPSFSWGEFETDEDDTITFVQPSPSSVAINRLTPITAPTNVYGTINTAGSTFVSGATTSGPGLAPAIKANWSKFTPAKRIAILKALAITNAKYKNAVKLTPIGE